MKRRVAAGEPVGEPSQPAIPSRTPKTITVVAMLTISEVPIDQSLPPRLDAFVGDELVDDDAAGDLAERRSRRSRPDRPIPQNSTVTQRPSRER
jgi:hypothetical protein